MSSKPYAIRRATKSGSWYESNSSMLNSQLSEWLSSANICLDCNNIVDVKAVIAPHAGYSYSGPIAAFAYASIKCLTAT